MTPTELWTGAGILLTFLLGMFNLFYKRKEVSQGSLKSQGDFMKTTNEAIGLANERALAAEKYAFDLEKRLDELERSLSYRLSFDVVLGIDPKVEHVEITHMPKV